MFERYTEKARRVIFFGHYEASQFGSPYIETEHLLLGLLREDKALTNRFLRSHASVESIRKQIEGHTVREKVSTSVDLPLSNECKRVLAYAAEEAERLSHKHIGTEHLLLGLLREEKCFAASLLNERNVRLSQVREQIQQSEPEHEARTSSGTQLSVILADFGCNLTQQAADGMLPPLVGREQELQRVIQVLCRLTRGNPVLLGDPGVGKKTIVYGLAQCISEGAVPELEGWTIVSLDLAVIASGTRSRSRFEDNLENILHELLCSAGGLILFIEGLQTLASGHRPLNLANVIKPALLDGRLQCISTATATEYSKTVETAPWLEQCFTTVEVKPPTEAEAIAVLTGIKDRFQKFHEVTYTDEAIQYAVFHSSSYFPNRSLPEKAIDLIDEAGARVKLREGQLPDEVLEAQKRIRGIVTRMEAAIANHEFEKARFHSDEEHKEREKLRALREKHQLTEAIVIVTRDDIEQIVAEKTGLSLDLLRKSKAEKPKHER